MAMGCQLSEKAICEISKSPHLANTSFNFRKFLLDQINLSPEPRQQILYTKVDTLEGDQEKYISFINDRRSGECNDSGKWQCR